MQSVIIDNMKTLRIVNEKGCVYVERNLFRRLWYRMACTFKTNIEAYNWVRKQKNVTLITKK